MSKELEALETLKFLVDNYGHFDFDFNTIETALKRFEELEKEWEMEHTLRIRLENIVYEKSEALRIIKENVGLKMSVDDNVGWLYVKTFEPLEKNIAVVGFVQGQDKIDLLKEVLL